MIEQEKTEDNHVLQFVQNAINKKFRMVICVEDHNKCKITASFNISEDVIHTARFLEKFARSHRE